MVEANLNFTINVVLWFYKNGYLVLIEDKNLDFVIAEQLWAEGQGLV